MINHSVGGRQSGWPCGDSSCRQSVDTVAAGSPVGAVTAGSVGGPVGTGGSPCTDRSKQSVETGAGRVGGPVRTSRNNLSRSGAGTKLSARII